jgi:hypothetical protein
MPTFVMVSRREHAAAKAHLKLDLFEGIESDPRIVAIANAKWPANASAKPLATANDGVAEPVLGRYEDPLELVAEMPSPEEVARAAKDLPQLTAEDRRRVLDMIVRGRPLGEIAALLGVRAPATVRRGPSLWERLWRGSPGRP